jgi:NADH-quinone oxidoreductase subunit L
MVAAGVYLVARLFPVFVVSDEAINTVAAIGAITAIVSATMGIVATDIKRVMAYSTISQLGYMMMGLGVGSLVAAIFHLFTHAFFKALLFLGAGSVNHATGTFDMRKMGGLARYMPVTFATMTVAGLALVGMFPLAGFWSKDEILIEAWAEKPWVFAVAMVGVFLTAVYVGRMLFMTFGGEYQGGEASEHGEGHGKPHESPWLMTAPLVVLAVLAATAGFANIGGGLGDVLEEWLPAETHELVAEGGFEWWISISSVGLGLSGLGVAWLIYSARLVKAEDVRSALEPLHALVERKYFLDDLYETVILKGVVMRGLATLLQAWDRYVIDGVVNGVAQAARLGAEGLRLAQAGQAQLYGMVIFIGVIASVAGILVVHP